jgi:protein ImuB
MIVCVLVPRFRLLAALGGEREALVREPVALAPEPGGVQAVGDVSPPAETFGVSAGMRVGEALARCPELRLVPPDPEGTRALWAHALDRLEAIGAAVESDLPGSGWFAAAGLARLHGGTVEGVLRAARRALAAPRAGAPGLRGARLAAAPSRFCAYAAARHARPRQRPPVVAPRDAQAFLAPLPTALLRTRPELHALPETLERLGIRTLGELASLPRAALAERFGHPGVLAHELARGRDTPLDPRRPAEPVVERLDLPEAASGLQLERALELLVARVLSRPERRGRTIRALALSARLVEGGTWRTRVTLRRASADGERIGLALGPKLAELPAPADALGVEVEAFGPPAYGQDALVEDGDAVRRARLDEAVRQAREAVGESAAMRVLEVDPDSRVPERRALLAPYEPRP